MGRVQEIYITPSGGRPMQGVQDVTAVEGAGLRGDRYMMRTGYWTGVDECQVTLIEGEALDEIAEATAVAVERGQHRRNIVTRDVDLGALRGARFKVGEAILEFDRPRPPCRYIQSVSERGMTKALGRKRGGICARVVVGGAIRAGDSVEVLVGAEVPAKKRSSFWG